MALVLDATLGGANSNTYVTLAEAETYFEARVHTSTWDALEIDSKNRQLKSATDFINQEEFLGKLVGTTQALEFPRLELPLVRGREVNSIIPKQIKTATFEMAFAMIAEDKTQDGTEGAVEEFQAGSFKLKFKLDENDNASFSTTKLPDYVESLLAPFSSSVSSAFNITVTRG